MALLVHDCDNCESRDKCEHQVKKQYDTLVCSAVKNDPLAFVDILCKEAESAEKGEHPSWDFAPLLLESACVIANLLLTDEEWHRTVKKENRE